MKKALYIFLLTAAISITAVAQADFDEPKWTKFEPPGEEFSVEFPNAAVKFIGRNSVKDSQAVYTAVQNKSYFAAFSEDDPDASVLKQVLGLAAGEVLTKAIEISGIKGQRYDLKGADDYTHSFIAIQAPAHFYIFHVISEIDGGPMAEQFLSSIKIERQIPAIATPTAQVTIASPGSLKDILRSPSPAKSNSPMGPEISDHALDNTVAPPKYSKIDSPLTILSKPSPSYTLLARRFMVTGNVRLRVTFEKKGEIGAITPLMKLPLGLTQSAISAARQIKFSPALRKGEPYEAAKVVEYNFNLY